MTSQEKILQELKQNGRMGLKNLEKEFGNKTHIELIQMVDSRKIGMCDEVGQDLQYYIKK